MATKDVIEGSLKEKNYEDRLYAAYLILERKTINVCNYVYSFTVYTNF